LDLGGGESVGGKGKKRLVIELSRKLAYAVMCEMVPSQEGVASKRKKKKLERDQKESEKESNEFEYGVKKVQV
jgi:hypothetical protein